MTVNNFIFTNFNGPKLTSRYFCCFCCWLRLCIARTRSGQMKWRKKWNFGLEIGINPLKQTTTHETEKANKVKQKGQLAYGNDYSQFRNRMITAIDEKSAVYGEIKIGSQWKQNAIVLMSHMKMHSKKCVIITCSVLICQAHTSYRCNCDYTVFFTICRIIFFPCAWDFMCIIFGEAHTINIAYGRS